MKPDCVSLRGSVAMKRVSRLATRLVAGKTSGSNWGKKMKEIAGVLDVSTPARGYGASNKSESLGQRPLSDGGEGDWLQSCMSETGDTSSTTLISAHSS